MANPQITYRGIPPSPAMDARIRELAAKLDGFHPRITRCHVVVAEPDRHKHKGNPIEVHVDIHVPGAEIVATRQSSEDGYAAISEAFDVVIRQLEDIVRKQRAEKKKVHREPPAEAASP